MNRLHRSLPMLLAMLMGACTAAGVNPAAPTTQQAEGSSMTVPRYLLPDARREAPVQQGKGQPYVFADAATVNIAPDGHGLWSAWDENNERWRIELHSRGARSLNLHFDRFRLPAGSELQLYTPANPSQGLTLTSAQNKPHGAYWSPQFSGDTLMVDLILPRRYNRAVDLHIANVNVAW